MRGAVLCSAVLQTNLYYLRSPSYNTYISDGGMMRLETLIELNVLNSSLSSSTFPIRAFRAHPLIEIRKAAPCRAIRGNSISVNSTFPPPYINEPNLRSNAWPAAPDNAAPTSAARPPFGGRPAGSAASGLPGLPAFWPAGKYNQQKSTNNSFNTKYHNKPSGLLACWPASLLACCCWPAAAGLLACWPAFLLAFIRDFPL